MTAMSPDSPTWSTGWNLPPKRSTRPSRTPQNVTGWPSSPGSRVPRRWMRGWRCALSRNGLGPWLVEPTRCGERPRVNVSHGFARLPGASECCARRVRRLQFMLGRRSWRSIWNAPSPWPRVSASKPTPRAADAEAALGAARASVRSLTRDFESLVDAAHRDDLARAEQQMKVDALAERAMAELGLEPAALLAEYGPDQLVPVLTQASDTPESGVAEDQPEPVRYVRDAQLKRLRTAEREFSLLGRVNPLALEEFDALEERHRFLSEQLEDLRKTRRDLLDIIVEVDNRVERVFAEAYADIAAAFERVFARLFPGGEGRLILTEPEQLADDRGGRRSAATGEEDQAALAVVRRGTRSGGGQLPDSALRRTTQPVLHSWTRSRRLSTTRISAACWRFMRSCGRRASCW